MNVSRTITECGLVIAEPGRWCQGALARNKNGIEISPKSRAAVRWSSDGIVFAVLKIEPDDFENRKLDEAAICLSTIDLCAQVIFKEGATHVNDVLGHAAILQCLRMAVKRARFTEVQKATAA